MLMDIAAGSLAVLTAILIGMVIWEYRKKKKMKIDIPIIDEQGWVLSKSFNLKRLEERCLKTEVPDEAIRQLAGSGFFELIHFRTKKQLLALLHAEFKKEIEISETLKHALTVSMLFHDFDLPKTLYSNDEVVGKLLAVLIHATKRVELDIYIKIYCSTHLTKEYVETEEDRRLVSHIPVMLNYIATLGYKRPMNVLYFLNFLKQNNKVIYYGVKGDVIQLCRLLTICYGIAKLPIPRDYIVIDDFVVNYLNQQTKFNKTKVKNYLRLVKG